MSKPKIQDLTTAAQRALSYVGRTTAMLVPLPAELLEALPALIEIAKAAYEAWPDVFDDEELGRRPSIRLKSALEAFDWEGGDDE